MYRTIFIEKIQNFTEHLVLFTEEYKKWGTGERKRVKEREIMERKEKEGKGERKRGEGEQNKLSGQKTLFYNNFCSVQRTFYNGCS